MDSIEFTLNMSWTCCKDGDMQTSQNRALLLVLVKTGSLSSSVYMNRCVGTDTHGHKDNETIQRSDVNTQIEGRTDIKSRQLEATQTVDLTF